MALCLSLVFLRYQYFCIEQEELL
uniref:Uncharacterized protein n=1 Tax=Anguilla anguilla TaxID=7936 RepID=A0A0E9THF0_ANGAN